MKIALVLCGNRYSEQLVRGVMLPNVLYFFHRSNETKLISSLFRYAAIASYLLVRGGGYLFGIEFVIYIPHLAKNYGKIFSLFNPNSFVLIDDGITFEYWSTFHDEHVAPLLRSDLPKTLIGPHVPNWQDEVVDKIQFVEVTRESTMNRMAKDINTSATHLPISQNSIAIVVDDGVMTSIELELISDFLRLKHVAVVLVVLHPSRKSAQSEQHLRLTEPVEIFILRNKSRTRAVFGKGSTALFNIAAISNDFPVYSFETNSDFLNESMKNASIVVVNEDFK